MSCKSKGAFPSNQPQGSEVQLLKCLQSEQGQTRFNWTTGTGSLPLNQTVVKETEKTLISKYHYYRKNWRELNTLLHKTTELNKQLGSGLWGNDCRPHWQLGNHQGQNLSGSSGSCSASPATCRHGGQHNTKASLIRGLKSQGDSASAEWKKTWRSCQKIGNFTSVFHSSRKRFAVCLLFNANFNFNWLSPFWTSSLVHLLSWAEVWYPVNMKNLNPLLFKKCWILSI